MDVPGHKQIKDLLKNLETEYLNVLSTLFIWDVSAASLSIAIKTGSLFYFIFERIKIGSLCYVLIEVVSFNTPISPRM